MADQTESVHFLAQTIERSRRLQKDFPGLRAARLEIISRMNLAEDETVAFVQVCPGPRTNPSLVKIIVSAQTEKPASLKDVSRVFLARPEFSKRTPDDISVPMRNSGSGAKVEEYL